ncbi:MAG TPA: aspartyl protease family protein [Candidatus Eisenbacteria bacterium]|nr:aspartyl protease family protein [Candidatus Eisenbacteria bacterium]
MFSEVGFRLVGGDNPLILVPANVNDRGPYEFILDTGAGTSLLSPRLAERLGITANGAREGQGAAGKVSVSLATADSLAVGGARRAPMPIAITAELDRIGAAVGQPIDGDIGYDFLKAFRVTIDYRKRLVRLVQGSYEAAGPASLLRTEVAFKLAGPVKPLVLVPAFVNGRGPHTFVVDTGASATVISPRLADALQIASTAPETMTGAGGVMQATVGRATSLVVGGAVLTDLSVVIADFLDDLSRTVGTTLDGIVGYNFLRNFRVTLDYPNGVLWLMKST